MNLRNIIREEMDNEWDWAINIQPIELQDPRSWIGSSFGYGQSTIDVMYDYEIERGDDKETFEITGVEEDYLLIVRHHPRFGRGGIETKTSIKVFIEEMDSGNWVWK